MPVCLDYWADSHYVVGNAARPACWTLIRPRAMAGRRSAGTAVSGLQAAGPHHCGLAGINGNDRFWNMERADYRGDC